MAPDKGGCLLEWKKKSPFFTHEPSEFHKWLKDWISNKKVKREMRRRGGGVLPCVSLKRGRSLWRRWPSALWRTDTAGSGSEGRWDSVKRLDVVVPSLSDDLYPLCLTTNGNICAFGVEQRWKIGQAVVHLRSVGTLARTCRYFSITAITNNGRIRVWGQGSSK